MSEWPPPKNPEFAIERIALRLPAGFQARAAGIAREFTAALATLSLTERVDSASIERLTLSPFAVAPQQSDREIARALVEEARRQLERVGR